jgi:predicted DNA-binding protein
MSKSNKKQIGVRLPPWMVKAIKDDAKKFGKSMDTIVQAALNHLFRYKQEERKPFYSKVPDKIFGRPIV